MPHSPVSSPQEPIDFDEFRKEYNIPSASARSIIKDLGLEIIRDGMKQYIVGTNNHNVDNAYLLKHAVVEWRVTMDIKNTIMGNFMEFAVVGDKIEGLVGISTITTSEIKPKTPSQKKEPNKTDGSYLIKSEKQLSQITAPTPINIKTGVVSGNDAPQPDALTALLNALGQVQQPDVLNTQKQLLEASQQSFRLTTEQLSALLGLSKQTIQSKKSGFIRMGFQYTKVKEGTHTLWLVSQVK